MSRLCEDLEKYDYSPVMGEPENGFYPVPKGRGTYYWNGERIVPKERGGPGERLEEETNEAEQLPLEAFCQHERTYKIEPQTGRNTVGMLRDDILDEFCKKHCPNRDEREFFEKYGRKCPNCYPESYHYWLIQR